MAQVTISTKKYYRCSVTVTVKDPAGNLVPGVTAAGSYEVSPDNSCTDNSSGSTRFPTTNNLSSFSGSVSVVSPDIPVGCKSQCSFKLTSVTAFGYTLTTALPSAIVSDYY